MEKILLISKEHIFDRVLREIADNDVNIDLIESKDEYLYEDYPDHKHIILEYLLEDSGVQMVVSGRHPIDKTFQDLSLSLRGKMKAKVPILTLPNSGTPRLVEHSKNRSRKMSWFRSIKSGEQNGKNNVCILQVGGLGSVENFADRLRASIEKGA